MQSVRHAPSISTCFGGGGTVPLDNLAAVFSLISSGRSAPSMPGASYSVLSLSSKETRLYHFTTLTNLKSFSYAVFPEGVLIDSVPWCVIFPEIVPESLNWEHELLKYSYCVRVKLSSEKLKLLMPQISSSSGLYSQVVFQSPSIFTPLPPFTSGSLPSGQANSNPTINITVINLKTFDTPFILYSLIKTDFR